MLEPDALYHAALQALRSSRNDEARHLCLRLIAVRPDFADGHFLLGLSEAQAGRLEAAISALQCAMHIAPRAEYVAHYAKCLVQSRRDGEALRAADRAASMRPTDPLTLDTLGCVYSRIGAHQQAVAMFELAVRQEPDHHQMRYNLASSLVFIGRIDEGADHYERILAADPHFLEVHSALADLKKQSVHSNHIARLEALLPLTRSATERLHLCHALAKEYEDLGDYDSAFRHLDAAKRQRKTEVGYRIDLDGRIFVQLVQKFGQEGYFQGQSDVTQTPVFVVGLPRTGTTLTERILSSHPEMESAGELRAMPLAITSMAGTSRPAFDPQTLEAAAAIDPATLGRRYLDLAAPFRRTQLRFVDKLPLNFFNVGFIARALPRARIVCLRRHPLDTVWSNYKHLFATNFSYYNYSYDLFDTASYYLLFDRLMKFWQQRFPGRVFELQYEAIVDDLEAQARRLLAFCELDWRDECLRFHENESAVATPSAAQVRQPIYRSSLGRWRDYEKHLAPVREFFAAHGVAA